MDPDSVNPSRHPSYRKSISASKKYKESKNIDAIYRDSLALSALKASKSETKIYKNSKNLESIYKESLALSASKSKLCNTNNKPPRYLNILSKSKSMASIYRDSLALSGKNPDSEIPTKIQKLDNETEFSSTNQNNELISEVEIKDGNIENVTTKNFDGQETSDESCKISKDP